MPYIGVSPTGGVRKVFSYTATAGQTSFSGSDNNSQTLSYSDSNFIDVFQNGVLLLPSDYTATSGTSVVLDTGATVSDSVQITVFDVFSVSDTVSKADGGTFDGNISIGGTLGVTGVTTFSAKPVFSAGGAGKILKFQKVTFTAEFQTQNDSFTDITNATLSFTPTASDSTLRITSMLHIYLGQGSSTTVGGAFQIVHDGTALEAPANQQYYKSAGSGTQIFQLPHYFTNYVSAGSTSARTIKAQGRCYAGSNAAEFLVNKGSAYTSHIEVLEIGA